jgi:hypothetical protein
MSFIGRIQKRKLRALKKFKSYKKLKPERNSYPEQSEESLLNKEAKNKKRAAVAALSIKTKGNKT